MADPHPPSKDLESTARLLALTKDGDLEARERLVRRHLPILQRWARGRLPLKTRGLVETDDLVQNTLVRALSRVEGFEPRREGAFLAYLRTILVNQIRDYIRRVEARPVATELEEDVAEDKPSPLERAIDRDTLEHYEAALATLKQEQKEAVILRLEMEFTYDQIAEAIGSPSANAARMTVVRALAQLAEVMNES